MSDDDDDRWPAFLTDGEDEPAAGAAPAASRSHRRPAIDVLARTTHGFGEVLLTVGAVLLLFVAYTLWWTGVETGQRSRTALKDELDARVGRGRPAARACPITPGATEPPAGLADLEIGDGVAVLRIPRFGPGYAWVVVEGIDLDNLARGPGHYPQTALPGEIGNFAVAGHRATHGEPFAQFEALELGDAVVVETADAVVHVPDRRASTTRSRSARAGRSTRTRSTSATRRRSR